jgi:hypothetical protein
MLKSSSTVRASKVLPYVLGGTAISALENATLLDDSDPKLKIINLGLGGVTGGLAGSGHLVSALGAWTPKQLALLGVDRFDKATKMQIPTAVLNRDAAAMANETARIMNEKAKRLTPTDIGILGLAAAGLAGAGGFGYYLYNKVGPRAKKSPPRVKITLPTAAKGDVETVLDADIDTLDLSKELHKRLLRDAKRRLREETGQRTLKKRSPQEKKEDDEAEQEAIEEEETPYLLKLFGVNKRASAAIIRVKNLLSE